ncbi:unnamed protein product [Cylindrotheca closterium]|uniref:Reverse transcriptase domain-containing protein n=1 Tax=Cylindrotheca closterium TaxID=2856 RepID=A0AAD2PUH5_9STRA|nr:unnamed protein product [Cylindrotheca closterium]
MITTIKEAAYQTFAATSATEEEEIIARRGQLPDGTKPVKVPKRIWRAQVKNVYEEPEADLDSPATHDWMFKEHGKTVIHFYILRCDDTVDTVGDTKFFITMDLDAGYWQIKMTTSSKEKTALFVPDGKQHFLVMPMGILSAHAFFVCVTIQFKKEWHELYKETQKQHYKNYWTSSTSTERPSR